MKVGDRVIVVNSRNDIGNYSPHLNGFRGTITSVNNRPYDCVVRYDDTKYGHVSHYFDALKLVDNQMYIPFSKESV
jgi:hypothetical protein